MTAAPSSFFVGSETAAATGKNWAIVFETSAHRFDPSRPTKVVANWAPHHDGGLNGDPAFFADLMALCGQIPLDWL